MNEEIRFLTIDDVVAIHDIAIAKYGGATGVRNPELLDSATAMAQATFDGCFLHSDIFEMAAAYAFHISQNQPFQDGNKRTGLLAGLVFLDINGILIDTPSDELYDTMIGFSAGTCTKAGFASILRKLARSGQV